MIVFLGAGASKPFGIPVTRDFATEAVNTLSRNPEYKDYSKFLHELKEPFGDEFDLEILLTLLDDLSREKHLLLDLISPTTTKFILNQEDPKVYLSKMDVQSAATKLFTGVADFMREKILQKTNEEKEKIMNLYDNLFAAINIAITGGRSGMSVIGVKYLFPPVSAIITTNYDTCIETFLTTRRINYEDCIERKYGVEYFDLGYFEADRGRGFRLLKLHGSLHLYKIKNGGIAYLSYPFTKKEQIKEQVLPLGVEIEDELILYPTETGGNRKIIESPFSDFYYYFRKYFEKHRKIVMVGFSLRDRTICSILDHTIASFGNTGTQAKIILIDPKASLIKENTNKKGFHSLSSSIVPKDFGIDYPDIIRDIGSI